MSVVLECSTRRWETEGRRINTGFTVDTGGQSEAHSRKTVRDSVSNQVKVRADSCDFPLTSTCVPHIYISCTQAKRGKVTHALHTCVQRKLIRPPL